MSAPASVTHPCEDCETGACPCGSGCEACNYTGACSSCWGSGNAPGPARVWAEPKPRRVANPQRGRTQGMRWARKPPMPPCEGCTRCRRSDSAYYGLPVEQVRKLVTETAGVRDRARCKFCSVPFGSHSSRWYLLALERGVVENPGHDDAEHSPSRVNP